MLLKFLSYSGRVFRTRNQTQFNYIKFERSTSELIKNKSSNYSTKSTEAKPEKTALYDFHANKNGKIVDFAGYLLPVQYSDMGISASHLHTRKSASIFDVSHMLQTYMRGKDVVECFESICTADVKGLKLNSGTLTVFTNDKGTILDDLIVSKINEDLLYIVSNAAMKSQDMQIMQDAVQHYKKWGKDVSVEFLKPSDQSLIALQGPKAVKGLQSFTKFDLNKLYFMNTITFDLFGAKDCRITRCGYTGEDGFEISVPSDKVQEVVEGLLSFENGSTIKLAGLGARDSLRLEAGLCLYGSDIDDTVTPVEAGLTWLVAQRRRADQSFPGGKKIVEQIKTGVDKQRIGIKMTSGPPARHGALICDTNGAQIGSVTSGCPSPSLNCNVAMGYVKAEYRKIGTPIQLKIRDKLYPTEVTKMPFVKTTYYMKPKTVPANKERTFIMVKPDGVHRGLVGKIIERFEMKGFKLVGLKLMWPDRKHIEKHYVDLADRPFFNALVEYMNSGPVVAMVWEGLNVVKCGRRMLGATNPIESLPGTIRGDYSCFVGRNIIHGSDAVESAVKEIALWFDEKEIVEWNPAALHWIYE